MGKRSLCVQQVQQRPCKKLMLERRVVDETGWRESAERWDFSQSHKLHSRISTCGTSLKRSCVPARHASDFLAWRSKGPSWIHISQSLNTFMPFHGYRVAATSWASNMYIVDPSTSSRTHTAKHQTGRNLYSSSSAGIVNSLLIRCILSTSCSIVIVPFSSPSGTSSGGGLVSISKVT